jgi:hypothetical protein
MPKTGARFTKLFQCTADITSFVKEFYLQWNLNSLHCSGPLKNYGCRKATDAVAYIMHNSSDFTVQMVVMSGQ